MKSNNVQEFNQIYKIKFLIWACKSEEALWLFKLMIFNASLEILRRILKNIVENFLSVHPGKYIRGRMKNDMRLECFKCDKRALEFYTAQHNGQMKNLLIFTRVPSPPPFRFNFLFNSHNLWYLIIMLNSLTLAFWDWKWELY